MIRDIQNNKQQEFQGNSAAYVPYWNLREKPFQNVVDLRFVYLAEQHREGLARLIYLVNNQKTGGVLTGPYGVGKSVIMELFARDIGAVGRTKYLGLSIMPGETSALVRRILELVEYRNHPADMSEALAILQNMAANSKTGLGHAVLAIDEAQLINDAATWQFLHLLTNIVTPSGSDPPVHASFTLILCGHTDLIRHLKSYPPLAQRMQLVWKLNPLTENQTIEYIQQRMRSAGGDVWVFTDDAMREIHRAANGLPRLINNVCDIALFLGYAAKVQKVTREIAQEAVTDTRSELLEITENEDHSAQM